MATTRLQLLSAQISEHTKVVDEYLQSHGYKLSFDGDSLPAFPADAPDNILGARRIVREATMELHDLMTGPSEHLRWFACIVSFVLVYTILVRRS